MIRKHILRLLGDSRADTGAQTTQILVVPYVLPFFATTHEPPWKRDILKPVTPKPYKSPDPGSFWSPCRYPPKKVAVA